MKNIHVIPTDKPSRLGYLTKKGKEVYKDLRLFDIPISTILDGENQNIYITSDEDIEIGKYYLCKLSMKPKKCIGDEYFNNIDEKKIILTTDQSLIEDGIQAIDDEFLEWFVKNPSCERVEVKPLLSNNGRVFYGYIIIIPQEEPKQETLEEAACNALGYDYNNWIKIHSKDKSTAIYNEVTAWCKGAKWQAERMYSEKEMLLAFETGRNYQLTGENNFKELIEQLNKK
jgi:hypothetical protein